jgi:death-on-curing protein
VLLLHQRIVEQSGGAFGIRDRAALDSALSQPKMTFEGKDLYPSLEEKAAALCYSLVNNHPFIDGNKRVGHAAMEIFLIINGYEIFADVAEQERIMLNLASGKMDRKDLLSWLRAKISPIKTPV